MGDSIFHPQAVPPSLVDVLPILRVAKEVEPGNFRVSYLCRFYAFEKAHRLDPTSSGRGVRHFKNSLLQTLERENDLTLKWRREKSDAREMQQFYLYYCEMFIQKPQNAVEKADRDLLTESYQTEAVLFEVLKAVNVSQRVEVDQEILETHRQIVILCVTQILETHRQIEEKRELYAPDNMLLVDPETTAQPIREHPEVLETHCKIEEKRELYAPDIMLLPLTSPPSPSPRPPPRPPMPLSQMATWDYFFGPTPTPPEKISDGEGSNDSSTSDYKGISDPLASRSSFILELYGSKPNFSKIALISTLCQL